MNIKRQVVENVKLYFQRELRNIEHEIRMNKREIKKLVEKQELLKRTKAKLDQINREIS